MSHVFGIFQIGPVQDFITCAKKTQDFWSGSYLLSYLTCVGMHEVVKGCQDDKTVIIYPDLTQQPLYDYVAHLARHNKTPWASRPSDEQLRPTVPNRFVSRLDEGSAKSVLDAAATKVTDAFRKIADHVKDVLWNKISHSSLSQGEWNGIWSRQTEKNAFEIYWVFSPLDDKQYRRSYEEAEALFGARKAIRNFRQSKEPGYKCTLCGQREPLHAPPRGSENRGSLRDFWDDVRKQTSHRFREGEHLCAVCTTKRLAPEWVFGREHEVPSTSSMAVTDFLVQLVPAYLWNKGAFVRNGTDILDEFRRKAQHVAKAVKRDSSLEPLPRLLAVAGTPVPSALEALLRLDGDWFIAETYDSIRREQEDAARSKKGSASSISPSSLEVAKSGLQELVEHARKACNKEALRPGKYYAVCAMDGDDLGDRIAACGSESDHRSLSRKQAEFARETAHAIIEGEHLGKVIYFGGDEGVAFVSLNDLLPTMDACRKAFEALRLGNASPTACIGAVIAHHQQALLSVLREVRVALKHAKDLDGKSAFCLSIMKRSGGTVRARGHWVYSGFEVVPLLSDLVGHYQADRLSARWWRQLAEEAWGFHQVATGTGSVTVDLSLVFPEIERLVTRHVSRDASNTIPGTQLTALIESLRRLALKLSPDWEAFMGLMEAATYIARGGGR